MNNAVNPPLSPLLFRRDRKNCKDIQHCVPGREDMG
jgi:hypothetical protein